MRISVIVIDNYDYGWFLGNSLADKVLSFSGRFTHAGIVQADIQEIPDVAIVAFDDTVAETQKTITFIREKYPAVKIIVNSVIRDNDIIDQIMKLPIQGLVFDALRNQEELKMIIKRAF